MKILATNNFNEKLKLYTDDTVKNKLLTLIEEIESSGNLNILIENSELSVDNFHVYKIGDYRIFFTIEESSLLFADIIKKEAQKIRISSKNPKYNSAINPKYNSKINPKYNSAINPKYNSKINPKYNSKINPKYNSAINPKYNSTINPKYNSAINPKYNSKINPKYNSKINPKMNPSFDGLFMFDLEGNNEYYIVTANENIILIYDNNNEIQRFGVKRESGFCLFEFNTQEYISFLEADSENGYNHFNLGVNWIGYLK